MAKKIVDASVVAGRKILVENQDKKPAANRVYVAIWIEDPDGDNEECLLFTMNELERARVRAQKNPEDIPEKGFFTDLFD
jgi:hypothetical protein